MGPFFGMVVSIFFVGGLIVAANKGYGYYDAVSRISFEFASISNLSLKNLVLSFDFTINANNPTSQPINIDAIFIDLIIVKAGRSITIAQIRKEDFNTAIKAKANNKLVLPIETNLMNAGPLLISEIVAFFTKQDSLSKTVFAVGNITAEGISIPIDEELTQPQAA